MSFEDIFCQDKAIDLLQRAFIGGKTAHAYIFAGPEGIGKFKTAREWARLLLCHEPFIENDFAESCGECRSCRLFDTGSHPDFNHIYKELREYTKDGKGKAPPVDLPIDVVREFLVEKVSSRPSVSQRKIFIVGEAEKLNVHSQNCLLKVLEEPPLYCCIVLLCTRLDDLLPTTKSRSQIIRFGPISVDRIVETLSEMGLDESRAGYFSRLADGSIGRACRWAELELSDANLYQTKKELVSMLAGYEYGEVLFLADELLSKGKKIAAVWADLDKTTSKTDISRRALKTLVQVVISAFQDAMKLNLIPADEIVNFDQNKQIEKLSRRFDTEQCAEKVAYCYQMLNWIDSSVNERLIFEHLLLSLADSDTMVADNAVNL
ncbi:MAG: DNA polymerase III subunit delta' [Sedimentisphaerales bacterium]|nr:DNA polymerase III subunit delta' [Sedimentisphaerales bacterium]